MPFRDSGKSRKSSTGLDTPECNKVCLHCGYRYGEHSAEEESLCPPNYRSVFNPFCPGG